MSAPTADRTEPQQMTVTPDTPMLEFVTPPPGFPGWHRGELVQLDGGGLLYSLRDPDADGTRLLVAPPWPFFPDYDPEIDDESVEALGLLDADRTALFVVVNPGETATGATVNLRAPIVVNVESRRAAQILLADPDLPVRAELNTTA